MGPLKPDSGIFVDRQGPLYPGMRPLYPGREREGPCGGLCGLTGGYCNPPRRPSGLAVGPCGMTGADNKNPIILHKLKLLPKEFSSSTI